MEDIEDKTTDELKAEFKELNKAHTDLKERMLKEWDMLLAVENRAKEVFNVISKRTNGI